MEKIAPIRMDERVSVYFKNLKSSQMITVTKSSSLLYYILVGLCLAIFFEKELIINFIFENFDYLFVIGFLLIAIFPVISSIVKSVSTPIKCPPDPLEKLFYETVKGITIFNKILLLTTCHFKPKKESLEMLKGEVLEIKARIESRIEFLQNNFDTNCEESQIEYERKSLAWALSDLDKLLLKAKIEIGAEKVFSSERQSITQL